MQLYLDFDGVMHPDGTPAINEFGRLLDNPELFCWLPILEELLDPHPDVRIIISSDWRRLFDDAALIQLIGPLGKRFAGVTEQPAADRAKEIYRDASTRGGSWLALDDHKSVKAAAQLDPRFIWCPPMLGISDPEVQALFHVRLDILNKK